MTENNPEPPEGAPAQPSEADLMAAIGSLTEAVTALETKIDAKIDAKIAAAMVRGAGGEPAPPADPEQQRQDRIAARVRDLMQKLR